MDSSDSATESPQGTLSSDSSPVESTSPVSSPASDTTLDSCIFPPHHAEKGSIHVPDMFSSIMAIEPTVNPIYHDVKLKAESWIAKLLQADDKWAARNSKADFAYMASIWAPSCDEEALRLIVDWNSWVFLFDDQFDEGHLSRDPIAAQEEIDKHLAIIDNTQPPVLAEESVIRYVFQTAWDRLKKGSSHELQQRCKDTHRWYFEGLLEQVKIMHDQRTFTRDEHEYMDMRRRTIGLHPAVTIAECALGIQVPQEIFNHPSLQECICVSADLVILVNDVLSYKKDLALGVDHNLITLLMEHGLSTQQAVDRIGTMLDDCYKRWYSALANMPVWGEGIDRQVLRYVDLCRNAALGNLHWSFKTGRYLGAEGDQVHETRMLRLPA